MGCKDCEPSETSMILDRIFDVIDDADATLPEILGALRAATIVYERQFNEILDEEFLVKGEMK